MRIGVTVDPNIPVPPKLYGGIERIVDFVVRELTGRGHQVTLFAHPDSRVPGELVPYGVPPHRGWAARNRELWQLRTMLWRRRDKFDAILSWGRLAALVPVLPLRRILKIQFYCRDSVPWRSVRIAAKLGGKSVLFSGSSASVYDQLPLQGGKGGDWHTMYYGVELERYPFQPAVPADAPLAFLGRIEKFKGTHTAIRIARAAGRRLIIAGNRVDTDEGRQYFESEVAPWLNGKDIEYIGPVDDSQKRDLLRSSAALLFPIEWREAFGIVMAEALACGTPVIGLPYGSVPEVVRDGINGFVCSTAEEAISAVARLPELSRSRVRADCESRFSSKVIVDELENRIRSKLEFLSRRTATGPEGKDAPAIQQAK